jgi:hypothetical protein
MRQMGLGAAEGGQALENRVLGLAERLTGRSYLTDQERSRLSAESTDNANSASTARSTSTASFTAGARRESLWNAAEGTEAASSFARRLAASPEGRARRTATLYRINILDRVARDEGYSYTADEVKEMRQLSHRHLPTMFAVHLLHSVARRDDSAGLAARIEIAKSILREGLARVVQRDLFLVSYGFGSRDFDSLFEMGDGHAVRQALVEAAHDDPALRDHLQTMGWGEISPATARHPRQRG